MKDKRYKPGQLGTIDRQVFRIIDGNKQTLSNCYITCLKCFNGNNGVDICGKEVYPPEHEHIYRFCCDLPYGYYLKRIL